MFGTSAEITSWLATLPKEVWSGVGTLLLTVGLGLLAKRSGTHADADKAARPVTPPQLTADPDTGGLTFLHEGQTEKAILDELRGLRGDQRARYAAEDARHAADEQRRLQDENVDLREELAVLRKGQGTTHGNQSEIKDELAATNRRLDDLMRRLDTH